MKYVITDEQNAFFQKNGFIEFEGLFSEEECHLLIKEAEKSIKEKKERDLFREKKEFYKTLFPLVVSSIAAELSSSKILRFGFDHVFVGGKKERVLPEIPFSEGSSIKTLAIGIMICIKGEVYSPSDTEGGVLDIFPHKKGNVIFFNPQHGIAWDILLERDKSVFLLFVLARDPVQYVFEPKDMYAHDLKRLGYAFGDLLDPRTHPVIYTRRK